MKINFFKKDGSCVTLDIDPRYAQNKVLAVTDSQQVHGLSIFLKDYLSPTVKRTNYQRYDFSDGSFEFREM
jgi:hypothetical protein